MKLNNKGMSIIEIVLSFALIMVMVVSMLTIVVNYRNKAQISIEKLEMDTFKNTLTQDIQNDILKLGLKKINEEGECLTITGLNNCINLVFQDGSMKAFGTSKVGINDRDSIENKYLYYDGIKYKLHETLPEVVPEGRNLVDLQTIKVEDNNILKVDSTIFEDGTDVSIYSIDVYISHINFKQDFGIHIVASTEDKSEVNGRFLGKAILEDNKLIADAPVLNTTFNLSGDKSGLYRSFETNTGRPTFYFRGDIKNNYVDFAGYIWRIVRINEDGTIRLIGEYAIGDSQGDLSHHVYEFNTSKEGILFAYYSESDTAKPTLDSWYQTNIEEKGYSDKVVSGEYFCEQAKISSSSSVSSYGGSNMIFYSEYTKPNFKCMKDNNNKGLLNTSIGLITYDEVIHAGGYSLKDSYNNYYLYNQKSFWTMSPSYLTSGHSSVWLVWGTEKGYIDDYRVDQGYGLRPVINLKADTLVTGSGLSSDKYTVVY